MKYWHSSETNRISDTYVSLILFVLGEYTTLCLQIIGSFQGFSLYIVAKLNLTIEHRFCARLVMFNTKNCEGGDNYEIKLRNLSFSCIRGE